VAWQAPQLAPPLTTGIAEAKQTRSEAKRERSARSLFAYFGRLFPVSLPVVQERTPLQCSEC
jgi:hypothetical protein